MLTAPQKLRALFFTNLILVIGYFIYAEINVALLLVACVYGIMLNLVGNNIGMHRYFSHKSFQLKNDMWIKVLSTLCCIGSQINYCMIHRQHHKFSDAEFDPHNPKEIGILRSLIMSYKSVPINPRIVRDLFDDKHLKFIHTRYYQLLIFGAIVLAAFGIEYLILFFSLPALFCWVSAVTIGIVPHMTGYRNYATPDNSHNSVIASILSIGEGWHNYHHANPKDYRHGIKWWEFDPAAKIIEWIRDTK